MLTPRGASATRRLKTPRGASSSHRLLTPRSEAPTRSFHTPRDSSTARRHDASVVAMRSPTGAHVSCKLHQMSSQPTSKIVDGGAPATITPRYASCKLYEIPPPASERTNYHADVGLSVGPPDGAASQTPQTAILHDSTAPTLSTPRIASVASRPPQVPSLARQFATLRDNADPTMLPLCGASASSGPREDCSVSKPMKKIRERASPTTVSSQSGSAAFRPHQSPPIGRGASVSCKASHVASLTPRLDVPSDRDAPTSPRSKAASPGLHHVRRAASQPKKFYDRTAPAMTSPRGRCAASRLHTGSRQSAPAAGFHAGPAPTLDPGLAALRAQLIPGLGLVVLRAAHVGFALLQARDWFAERVVHHSTSISAEFRDAFHAFRSKAEQSAKGILGQHLVGALVLAAFFGCRTKVVNIEQGGTEYDCYDKQLLGEGSSGKVWLVKRRSKAGQFALKQVSCCSAEEHALAKNEVQFMRALKGSRFIALEHADSSNDLVTYQNNVSILMEAAVGGDLLEAVSEQPLARGDAARLFLEVLEGVVQMHRNGFVHRDLKLENVLLSKSIAEGGHAKIADFGSACARWGPLESVAPCVHKDWRSGWRRISGTENYMAPETLNAEQKSSAWTLTDVQMVNDPKVDMWALGVMLHTMLADAMPFEHKDDLTDFVFHAEYVPYRDDSEACALVSQLLETDPSKRSSAEELLPRVRAWASRLSTE